MAVLGTPALLCSGSTCGPQTFVCHTETGPDSFPNSGQEPGCQSSRWLPAGPAALEGTRRGFQRSFRAGKGARPPRPDPAVTRSCGITALVFPALPRPSGLLGNRDEPGTSRDEAGSSAPQCPCRKGFSAAEPSLGFSLLPSRGMHGSVQGRLAPASGWHCPQGVTAQGGPGLRVAQDRGKAPGRFQGSWAVEPSALPGGRADSAAVNNLERARGSRGAARDVSVGLCGWGAPGEHPRGASQSRLPITRGFTQG